MLGVIYFSSYWHITNLKMNCAPDCETPDKKQKAKNTKIISNIYGRIIPVGGRLHAPTHMV